jgi:hypothetical protein
MMRQSAQAAPGRRPIETKAEAEELIAQLSETLEALLRIVEHETALVRAGSVGEASKLEAQKAELAGKYHAATERVKQNTKVLAALVPAKLDALRRRHDMFRPLLQINLTVLATAHAVSQSIIRGVAEEVTRKSAPSTYGMSGRANAPSPTAAKPVTLSRTL